MIRDLDMSLQNLLAGEAPGGSELAGATISFGVPDEQWRGQGAGLDLDVYLYQILENRELRSNERRQRPAADGTVTVEQFPARVECCYLMTAWNKADNLGGVARELQEHRLLSQVLAVLLRNPVLPRPYLAGSLAAQEIDLPMISAQADGAGTLPDFWTGLDTYLRPAITCKVTLALDLKRDATASMVTTAEVRYGDGDTLYLIGGTVWDKSAPPRPVPGAWVRIDQGPTAYVADDAGRFRVERLAPGAHTLTVRALGFVEAVRNVTVPQPDGLYDVQLDPI